MSMIRDLRAAVRPSLRKRSRTAPARYDTTRDPSAGTRRRRLRRLPRRPARRRPAPRSRPHEAMRRVRQRRAGSSGSVCTSRPRREFAGIAREFGLHPLAVEDAVHAHQRPKLERYDDTPVHRLQDHPLRRARRTHRHQRGGGDRRGDVLHRPGLRHHRPARRPGLAARAAAPPAGRPRAARQGPLGGAARHRRPGRRRLSRGRRRRAGRHRRGRDRGLLRPRRQGHRARRRTPGGSTSSSARCWSSSGPSRRCCGRCSC